MSFRISLYQSIFDQYENYFSESCSLIGENWVVLFARTNTYAETYISMIQNRTYKIKKSLLLLKLNLNSIGECEEV